jgi:hypothetical protein
MVIGPDQLDQTLTDGGEQGIPDSAGPDIISEAPIPTTIVI